MAITIFDYVKTVIGDHGQYTAEDFYRCGVEMLGGCEYCHATIGPWNAYPSISGYWRCGECIGAAGYQTIGEFTDQVMSDFKCPSCGAAGHIWQFADGKAYSLSCRHCGTSWTRLP